MPERSKSATEEILPFQSIGNRGWEPRPLQTEPLRWLPPGPWEPDDPEAFTKGWDQVDGPESD